MQVLLPDLGVDLAPALEAGGKQEDAAAATHSTLQLELTDAVDSSIAWEVVLDVIYDRHSASGKVFTLQQLEAGLRVCDKYHGQCVQAWLAEKVARSIGMQGASGLSNDQDDASTRELLRVFSPTIAQILQPLDEWEKKAGASCWDPTICVEVKYKRLVGFYETKKVDDAQKAIRQLVSLMEKVGRGINRCRQNCHYLGPGYNNPKMAHTIWANAVKSVWKESSATSAIPHPLQALDSCRSEFQDATACKH